MALSKSGQTGVKFRRQAAIGKYVVDFVCFSHGLIVELDGPQHVEEQGRAHDMRRTAWLESQGYRVIRFRNQMLDDQYQQVVEKIKIALHEQVAGKPEPPPHKVEGARQVFLNNEPALPNGTLLRSVKNV